MEDALEKGPEYIAIPFVDHCELLSDALAQCRGQGDLQAEIRLTMTNLHRPLISVG
jgi:hypothetical protein